MKNLGRSGLPVTLFSKKRLDLPKKTLSLSSLYVKITLLVSMERNEFAMGTIRLEARHSCHAIISFFSLLCLCGRIQQKNSWHMTLIPRNKPSQTPFRESILFFTNAWILSFGCQNTRRHVLTPRPSLVCNWLWTQHQHLFQSLKIMLIASYTSTLRRNPHLMPWKLKLR